MGAGYGLAAVHFCGIQGIVGCRGRHPPVTQQVRNADPVGPADRPWPVYLGANNATEDIHGNGKSHPRGGDGHPHAILVDGDVHGEVGYRGNSRLHHLDGDLGRHHGVVWRSGPDATTGVLIRERSTAAGSLCSALAAGIFCANGRRKIARALKTLVKVHFGCYKASQSVG